MAYLLAHDLGTSGNKAVLYSETGILIASCLQTYSTQYPHDGWVEQDAMEIWTVQLAVCRQALQKLGIQPEECTPDGMFSLTACRCIGACGLAPVLTVNEDVYGRLVPEDVDKILAKYTA